MSISTLSVAKAETVGAKANKSKRLFALLPAIPPGLIVLALFILPMLIMVQISFRPNVSGMIGEGYSLESYRHLFSEEFYLSSFWLTILMSSMVGVCVTVMSLPVAYFLARTKSRWKVVLLLLALAPELAGAVLRTYG